MLDPTETPFVRMPDSKAGDTDGPCTVWIMPRSGQGYCPTEAAQDSWEEAERACGATKVRMGWNPKEFDRIILTSMSSRTA